VPPESQRPAITIPTADARVRHLSAGKSVKPEGDTVVEDGDEVFSGGTQDIRVVMRDAPRRGAARVWSLPAAAISAFDWRVTRGQDQVKLIERDGKRARRVSEQ